METRILSPREDYLADFVNVIAFEGSCDLEKLKADAAALTDEEVEKILHPEAGEDALPSERLRKSVPWGTFDGDRIISAMYVMPYTVRFAGEQVLMGGIGGVASLPDSRRGGGVRALMKGAFREMYDQGFLLSELYPFSTEYYKQYGFEKGMKVNTWTLPLERIRPTETGGRVRQLLPGDDLSPLTEIYNQFYADWNLSTVRRQYDPKMDLQKMMNEQRYVFVWEDDLGTPKAFMITKKVMVEGQPVMDCTHSFRLRNGMLFLSGQGFRALLTFVKKVFSADYRAIRFSTPDCLFMDALVGEGTGCRREGSWNGMVRLVNVEKALTLCRCRGEGSLVLNVTDPMLRENEGGWRITYAPGQPNRVERTTDAPDLTLTIGDLSALLCGIRSGEELQWMPGVQIHDPSAPYEQIFYPQKCFTTDLF